jgi:anti-anti-sigma factor
MELQRRNEPGGIIVFSFAGEFESVDLPALSKGIDQLVDAGRNRLVFNFKDLRFINSAALGYLCELHASLPDEEGQLVISEPSAEFEKIVSTLGIDQLLTICPNDAEALTRF